MAFGIKNWARNLKRDATALWIASKDPRTPRVAKILAFVVVGYLFCPIDLIPDWIPLLGAVDDLILVPIGIAIVVRMIPKEVMADARQKASEKLAKPSARWMAWLVVSVWCFVFVYVVWLIVRR